MNKRIRKKQLKRSLCELVAAYNEYEAAHEHSELTFRKAVQRVTDAHLESREEIQWYLKMASLNTRNGDISAWIRKSTS